MKRMIIVVLIACVVMVADVLEAQTTLTNVSKNSPGTKALQQEVEKLRSENERLRKERDAYRADMERGEALVSANLKALSAALSKEIKDDFYGSATRILWIMAILVTVATAGGFWKMSDIITSRVNEKVDEKEKAFQRLSDQLFDDLTKLKVKVAEKQAELEGLGERMREELDVFGREADEYRRKVKMVGEQAVTEMRSKVIEVSNVIDSTGKESTVVTQAESSSMARTRRHVSLPPGLTRVFPAGLGQLPAESLIRGKVFGNFSYYFTQALLDPLADADGDGKVSLLEAVVAAGKSLKNAGLGQDPDLVGPAGSVALLALQKVSNVERPPGRLLAVLVGINEYSGSIPRLAGAVNDVVRFQKILENRSHLLASEAVCHVLTDKEATRAQIEREIEWLRSDSSSQDIALFFFSGHETQIPNAKHKKKAINIIVPHDAGDNLKNCIKEPDLLGQLSKVDSRAKIYITG